MTEEKIVVFPKQKKDSPPQTMEDIYRNVALVQERFSHDICEEIWKRSIDQLETSGVDVHGRYEEFAAVALLMLESMKALHLLSVGHYHPLQEYAEEKYREDANYALSMIEQEEAEYEE